MIETDLSDFHKMLVALMKMHFPKIKPRVNRYRKYKTFRDYLAKKVLGDKGLDAF